MIEAISTLLDILAILAVLTIAYKAITWSKLHRAGRTTRNKFRLYSVRDQFVQLVATEQLKEDSWIFKTFYVSINRIVSRQHEFNLLNLVRSMRDETAMVESAEFSEKLLSELQLSTPEVRQAVEAFYEAMVEIVMANSLLLRETMRLGHSAIRFWTFLDTHVRPKSLVEPSVNAFKVYRSSGGILDRVRLASY